MDLSKQVEFTKPLPDKPTVAIIGGGLSGLSCAAELARLGIKSVVFDTGQYIQVYLCGRCAPHAVLTRNSRHATMWTCSDAVMQ